MAGCQDARQQVSSLGLGRRPSGRRSPGITGGSSRRRVHAADSEEAGLDEEIPHAARLVHVDLDEVTRLAPAELPTAPRVLANECLFDDEVWLREDAQLRAERLLFWCEQVQCWAIRKVERRGCGWNERGERAAARAGRRKGTYASSAQEVPSQTRILQAWESPHVHHRPRRRGADRDRKTRGSRPCADRNTAREWRSSILRWPEGGSAFGFSRTHAEMNSLSSPRPHRTSLYQLASSSPCGGSAAAPVCAS